MYPVKVTSKYPTAHSMRIAVLTKARYFVAAYSNSSTYMPVYPRNTPEPEVRINTITTFDLIVRLLFLMQKEVWTMEISSSKLKDEPSN